MITFLYVVYVMVCLFLILVVLLQAGRGGMGAAFGGSSQTVFGGSGAGNFLTRLTVISAALFMMLSAALTYVSSSGEKSLEKATERIRMREEARSEVGADADKKTDKAKPAEGDKSTSEGATSSPDTAPQADQADKAGQPDGLEAEPSDKPAADAPAAEKPEGAAEQH
jgi:preprotein translocase subunit SecG